ncbi:trypsin-like peptidase domain-containing protein [Litorimonas sp. RW-G-Af-16]
MLATALVAVPFSGSAQMTPAINDLSNPTQAQSPSSQTTQQDFVPLRDLGQGQTRAVPSTNDPAQPVIELYDLAPTDPPATSEAALPLGPSVTTLNSPPLNMMTAPVSSLPSIADLVANVSPSVVNIVVTTENGETTSEGQGSGFVISDKLEVVTNYHVIEGGTFIDIEFNNGDKFPAKIIGTDEETDLALLQIQTTKQIPHVDFHSGESIRIGDWVVAIGNPFGIGQSTSLGVISAIGRERVESGSYVDYIQTDATINRGNSGGPLFDLDGKVVGVNSAIYSPTGASVGIAFVIPHHTALEVVDAIRADGKVRRGYLGAGLRTATFEMDGQPGIFKAGATINNVVAGGPADTYGLQVDDIILRINDQAVRNSVEATRAIAALRPGAIAKIIYERDEKAYQIDLSIGERPEKADIERANAISQGLPPPPPKETPHAKVNIDTGLHLLDLSAEFRTAIGMRSDQVGVYVEAVDPGSDAEAAGFKMGMVLLDADAQPITEVAKFKSIVLNAKIAQQDGLVVNVRRKDGQETYMVLPLPL